MPPGPRVLYVRGTRTSHGRTGRTAYRGTPGKDHLVTGGLYKWLRHPNYTGEVFGWSASFAAALIAGAAAAAGGVLATTTTLLTNPWIGASALGWLGIMFVLAGEASVPPIVQKNSSAHPVVAEIPLPAASSIRFSPVAVHAYVFPAAALAMVGQSVHVPALALVWYFPAAHA